MPQTAVTFPPRNLTGFAAALFFVTAFIAQAADDTLTVRMTGRADGVGATARKMAIEDAEQQVVTEVLNSLIGAQDLTPFRSILRHASGYVQRYDLLRCDIAGTSTQVELDVFVLEKPLRQDVAAVMLPRLPRHPSVLMITAEQQVQGSPFVIGTGSGHRALKEGLEKYGFIVSGPDSVSSIYNSDQLLEMTAGGVEAGSHFAKENSADVLMTVQADVVIEKLPDASNMVRNRARVALRIFSGADGKMMDSLGSESVVQSVNPTEGGDQAISDAAGKLVTDATVSVVLSMLSLQDKSRVLITVSKPDTEEAVHELGTTFKSFPGVLGVEETLVSPVVSRLSINYDGQMARLADLIQGMALSSGKVDIIKAVGREIIIQFTR